MITETIFAAAFLVGAALPLQEERRPEATTESQPAQVEQKEAAKQSSSRTPDRFLSLRSRTMTGDWGGLRQDLRDSGIDVHVFVTARYQAILSGGLSLDGGDPVAASHDTLISFDFEKMGLIKDADGLIHAQNYWEDGINLQTGALQQVNDDADGDKGLLIDQLWFRKYFWNRRISLMLGFVDFQTIADRNAFANSEDKQFWNQMLDNNPLIPLNIGLGAALTVKPVSWYTLILGFGDAQSVLYKPGFSTAFHDERWFRAYWENDFHLQIPTRRGPLEGNYRFGFLYEPTPRAVFPRSLRDVRTRGSDVGFYVSLDQMLYRERVEDDQGLGVFARFAYRNPEFNRMSRFWSGGLQYKGIFPERDKDVLGLAFALQRSSHLYRQRVNHEFSNETAYELYYAIQVTPWLVISPDVQYVDNPGASDQISHVVVAGIRVRVAL